MKLQRKHFPCLLLAAASLVNTGCDREVAQIVTVDVAEWTPAPQAVRLYAAPECTGEFLIATNPSRGKFMFRTSSTKGGVGVVTQELSLCHELEGHWK